MRWITDNHHEEEPWGKRDCGQCRFNSELYPYGYDECKYCNTGGYLRLDSAWEKILILARDNPDECAKFLKELVAVYCTKNSKRKISSQPITSEPSSYWAVAQDGSTTNERDCERCKNRHLWGSSRGMVCGQCDNGREFKMQSSWKYIITLARDKPADALKELQGLAVKHL